MQFQNGILVGYLLGVVLCLFSGWRVGVRRSGCGFFGSACMDGTPKISGRARHLVQHMPTPEIACCRSGGALRPALKKKKMRKKEKQKEGWVMGQGSSFPMGSGFSGLRMGAVYLLYVTNLGRRNFLFRTSST